MVDYEGQRGSQDAKKKNTGNNQSKSESASGVQVRVVQGVANGGVESEMSGVSDVSVEWVGVFTTKWCASVPVAVCFLGGSLVDGVTGVFPSTGAIVAVLSAMNLRFFVQAETSSHVSSSVVLSWLASSGSIVTTGRLVLCCRSRDLPEATTPVGHLVVECMRGSS